MTNKPTAYVFPYTYVVTYITTNQNDWSEKSPPRLLAFPTAPSLAVRLPEVIDARLEVGEARILVARRLRELPLSLLGQEPANERALRDVERLGERVSVVVRLQRGPDAVEVERRAS